ncbi:unnamed protein product, partial [Aphanomyces euteiches]
NETVVNQAATDEADEPTVPTDQDNTTSSEPLQQWTTQNPTKSTSKLLKSPNRVLENANHIFINAPVEFTANAQVSMTSQNRHPMEYSPARSFYGWPHQVPMQRPMGRATFGEPFPASMFGEPMGFYRTPVW